MADPLRTSKTHRAGAALAGAVLALAMGSGTSAWAHGNEPTAPLTDGLTQDSGSVQAPGPLPAEQTGVNPLALLIVGGGALAAAGATMMLIKANPQNGQKTNTQE